jgi:N-acetylglucosaminyldiphosphoundecaprenol N-acetyl-beta-D-mannosaminyltransferase
MTVIPLAPPRVEGATRVWLAGVCLDAITEDQVVDQVIASSLVGRGGWIATPNIFFLRRASADVDLFGLLAGATLRVPDGAPLIWANKLGRGAPLHRVTGASLMISLGAAASKFDRSMYILGGRDGAAEEAAEQLQKQSPGLRIVGAEGPWISPDLPTHEVEPLIARLEAAQPDIVMIGVGFPKQERFIAACRERLPHTWFLGCGAAINFAAGYERRAPVWMQRAGLEWLHRLAGEPRRLCRRYAADAPFALRLLAVCLWQGLSRRTAPVMVPPTPAPLLELPIETAPEPIIDLRDTPVVSTGLLNGPDLAEFEVALDAGGAPAVELDVSGLDRPKYRAF